MTVTEQEKRATETLSKAFQSVSAPKREYLLGFLEGFAARARRGPAHRARNGPNSHGRPLGVLFGIPPAPLVRIWGKISCLTETLQQTARKGGWTNVEMGKDGANCQGG